MRVTPSAGTVTVRLRGPQPREALAVLRQVGGVDKLLVVSEGAEKIEIRLVPKLGAGRIAGEICQALAGKGLRVDELHTEEGRLDEYFRAVTVPDTVPGGGTAERGAHAPQASGMQEDGV